MARLEYINNAGTKTVLKLGAGMTVTIGRNPDSKIHTSNPSVSRNHGRIAFTNGAWFIKDLGSSNGTFVNDEPVQQSDLHPTDRIRCGDFVITFVDEDGGSDGADAGGGKDGFAVPDSSFEERSAEPPKNTLRPRPMQPTSDSRIPIPPVDLDVRPRSEARADSRAEGRRRSEPSRTEASRTDSRAVQEPAPVRATSSRTSSDEALLRQVKEQAAEIETLSQDLKEHRSQVSDLEHKAEESQNRASRYELELDSITEKYVQIKDQLTIQKERLEESREEAAEKDDKIFALEGRIAELEGELEATQSKAVGSHEQMANFKIRLTQKDRQLEELQRQFDLMEFELRAAKEEIQSLQDGINIDNNETNKLEKRVNQLREIMADKENVIAELRQEVENKDIEIRQVRMGMGMGDLEDEKRKLLADYHEKSREVDKLRDEVKKAGIERKEIEGRVAAYEEEHKDLEKKKAEVADITSHPDYKAKVREMKRFEERAQELEGELKKAEERLSEFSGEEKKRLQGEVAFFKRKSTTIEEKLLRTSERVTQLEEELAAKSQDVAPPPPPAPSGVSESEVEERLQRIRDDLGEGMGVVQEMFVQWRSNFSLFRTYLKSVAEAVSAVAAADPASLPEELRGVLENVKPAEAMEDVQNLLRVVDTDATALRQGLNNFKKTLGG